MAFATNAGVRLHWDERGTGSPVLLIMGHVFSSDMWYPAIPALSEHHRVIWLDNRGTGRSDATRRATISDLAADARAVLDAAGVEQAHVYGVSMGGGVALQLAYETPERVRSLVLGCTAFRADEAPGKGPLGRLAYYLPLRLLRSSFRKGLYGPACPPEAAERDLNVLVKLKKSTRGLLGQVEAMSSYELDANSMARLTQPALVLHGDVDTTVVLARGESLDAALPRSRLIVYPGAGDSYHVAYRDQVNPDVLAFLEEADHVAASAPVA